MANGWLGLGVVVVNIWLMTQSPTRLGAEEGKGEAQPSPSQVPSQNLEYVKLEGKMNSLHARVQELEKTFQAKARAIELTRDPQAKSQLARELLELTKERNAAAKEYMEIRDDLRSRFPAKGDLIEKQYLTLKPKSSDEMAQADDLDSELTELKKKVEQKYRSNQTPVSPMANKAAPMANGNEPERSAPKRLKLVK
jgi:chromosome segregation ATPase